MRRCFKTPGCEWEEAAKTKRCRPIPKECVLFDDEMTCEDKKEDYCKWNGYTCEERDSMSRDDRDEDGCVLFDEMTCEDKKEDYCKWNGYTCEERDSMSRDEDGMSGDE